MTAASTITTADQLFAAGDTIGRCELVRGELIMMSPAGGRHGLVTVRLTLAIGNWADQQNSGYVFAAETGFVLERNPDTVRAPDVAFVRRDRLANAKSERFISVAPDMVAETLSPSDTASEVAAKVRWWLDHEVGLVWVIDPANEMITEHFPDGRSRVYRRKDHLVGGEVLPNFMLKVDELFR